MQVDGKQFADAPESSAAWMVLEGGSGSSSTEVLSGPKVTLLLMLLADFTCEVFVFFKMDLGDLVDMLDTVESDDLVVAIVIESDLTDGSSRCWFKEKSEVGARLQHPAKRFISWLKRSFLGSCKRAAPPWGCLNFGLEAYPAGLVPSRTSLQLLQLGGCGECCFARGSYQ